MTIKASPIGDRLTPFGYGEDTVVANTGVTNLRAGPTDMHTITCDNTVAGASANWLKIYDSAGDGLALDGTDEADFIVPVAAVGLLIIWSPGGHPLASGCSYAASKENGITLTAAPDQSMAVYFGLEDQ